MEDFERMPKQSSGGAQFCMANERNAFVLYRFRTESDIRPPFPCSKTFANIFAETFNYTASINKIASIGAIRNGFDDDMVLFIYNIKKNLFQYIPHGMINKYVE